MSVMTGAHLREAFMRYFEVRGHTRVRSSSPWVEQVSSHSRFARAWPYAPVVEALADVCRQHPTLLDGLGDHHRQEIDRALAGAEMAWAGLRGVRRD